MPMICEAYNCFSEYNKTDVNVMYHRFPANRGTRRKWIRRLKLKSVKLKANSRLCSKHFTSEDYVTSSNGKKLLRTNAVPSVFEFEIGQKINQRISPTPTVTSENSTTAGM